MWEVLNGPKRRAESPEQELDEVESDVEPDDPVTSHGQGISDN